MLSPPPPTFCILGPFTECPHGTSGGFPGLLQVAGVNGGPSNQWSWGVPCRLFAAGDSFLATPELHLEVSPASMASLLLPS